MATRSQEVCLVESGLLPLMLQIKKQEATFNEIVSETYEFHLGCKPLFPDELQILNQGIKMKTDGLQGALEHILCWYLTVSGSYRFGDTVVNLKDMPANLAPYQQFAVKIIPCSDIERFAEQGVHNGDALWHIQTFQGDALEGHTVDHLDGFS